MTYNRVVVETTDNSTTILCTGKGPNSCPANTGITAPIVNIVDNEVIAGNLSGVGTYQGTNYSWKNGSTDPECSECPEYDLDIIDL